MSAAALYLCKYLDLIVAVKLLAMSGIVDILSVCHVKSFIENKREKKLAEEYVSKIKSKLKEKNFTLSRENILSYNLKQEGIDFNVYDSNGMPSLVEQTGSVKPVDTPLGRFHVKEEKSEYDYDLISKLELKESEDAIRQDYFYNDNEGLECQKDLEVRKQRAKEMRRKIFKTS